MTIRAPYSSTSLRTCEANSPGEKRSGSTATTESEPSCIIALTGMPILWAPSMARFCCRSACDANALLMTNEFRNVEFV